MDINEKIVGKTIKLADINGDGIVIEFTDGSVFKYYATDGGYSTYELLENK